MKKINKEQKKKPWEYLTHDLSVNKTVWNEFDEEFVKGYQPFLINKYLSYCGDWAISIANMLNKQDLLENKQAHYLFLFNILPKTKLYMNWIKGSENTPKEWVMISEYFEVGVRDSRMYEQFLDDDAMEYLNKIESYK